MLQLRHLEILNFKSIAECRIDFSNLCFVVGKNASGKSNLLDAIDFAGDALVNDPDSAIRHRGGLSSVITKSLEQKRIFSIRFQLERRSDLEVLTASRSTVAPGEYSFEIEQISRSTYRILSERCYIGRGAFFERTLSRVTTSIPNAPRARKDRLYLSLVSGFSEFSHIFEFLTNLTIYSPDVLEMRKFQPVDDGSRLANDGWNFASVLRRISRGNPKQKQRIEEYLSAIVPGVEGLTPRAFGPSEAVEFVRKNKGRGPSYARRFYSQDMSDGTLRALALLIAIFQSESDDDFVPLIGIEEPETGLHPAATAMLYDAMREGSRFRQIIATSHSPELLDRSDLRPESILIAELVNSRTQIRQLDSPSRTLIQQNLITPGELLRRGQLESDESSLSNEVE